jgi:hypothetical protein
MTITMMSAITASAPFRLFTTSPLSSFYDEMVNRELNATGRGAGAAGLDHSKGCPPRGDAMLRHMNDDGKLSAGLP